jgi:hypothetical protein
MHFHDNQRKVDYVLAYHYRKRGAHLSQGSPGHSLAVISNGETGKERQAGGPGDIELGPLDALEEEKREQREEFEHNLISAGLELEKDLEVRQAGARVLGQDGALSFFLFWGSQIFLPKDLRVLVLLMPLPRQFQAVMKWWWYVSQLTGSGLARDERKGTAY